MQHAGIVAVLGKNVRMGLNIRPQKYIKKSLKQVNSFIASIIKEGKVVYE